MSPFRYGHAKSVWIELVSLLGFLPPLPVCFLGAAARESPV